MMRRTVRIGIEHAAMITTIVMSVRIMISKMAMTIMATKVTITMGLIIHGDYDDDTHV